MGARLVTSFWRSLCCGLLAAGGTFAEPIPDPAELPRIPPKGIQEAIASFQLADDFRIELAAGEPQVVDPVAVAFDEDGRMFVAEMRGYPERRAEALGRIKLLEDVDGDGHYEKATVFAEGLKWPTGVVCWGEGVFVAASPEILYFADRDRDGVAEERKVVFTGFGAGLSRLNMQALVNGLQWGPDGRIYGSTASNGGLVRPTEGKEKALNLRGSDFSFDPETLDLRPESGTGQYGLTFDDYGRRYLCSNSRHLIAVMYSWPWNRTGGLPHPLVDIPDDGGAAEVFRLSRVEPWRVVRTRWRVQGLVGGPVEGGGRASGYITSASGLTIYRGDALPPARRGTVFVGDVGSNLVHHKRIEFPQERVQPVASRPEKGARSEFLASTDNWFRPVQCANGPDGALYIVDMYRETIEHPWSIPESIKKHLDLYSGNDRGRIWRVVPKGFKSPPMVARSKMELAELVALLESSNGWERDTAMRLVLQRKDPGAAARVADLAINGKDDMRVRAQAFRLLDRLRPLTEEEKGKLVAGEKSPEVRRQLVRMWKEVDAKRLADWSRDPDIRVRFEGLLRALDPKVEVTTELLRRFQESAPQDPWMRRVVVAAARVHGVLPELVGDQRDLKEAVNLLQEAGVKANDPMARAWLEAARAKVAQAEIGGAELEAAVWLIANDPQTKIEDLLGWILRGDPSATSAASALRQRPAASWEAKALKIWEELPTALRGGLLEKMSDTFVLSAIEGTRLAASEIGFRQRRKLLQHGNENLRKRSAAIFGAPEQHSRKEAALHYRPALKLKGGPKSGAKIFTERCFICHRDDGKGAGPDLATLRNKGAPMLLENLIAPELEVAPQYHLWEVRLKDDSVLAGVIAEEGPERLLLRFADGSSRNIPRKEIIKLANLNRSIMPAGLEAGLSLQEMADLLSYITGHGQ